MSRLHEPLGRLRPHLAETLTFGFPSQRNETLKLNALIRLREATIRHQG